MSGVLAIVGRPNVGKSALFNRIVGRRIAIVHDQPGVTRDRISAEAEWHGGTFTVVDTGGIGLLKGEKVQETIVRAAHDQIQLAVESADVLVLVVSVQEGVVPLDREVAVRLRKAGKPVLVAVNKVDTSGDQEGINEFAELGFDGVFPVSAIHNRGIGALLDAACAALPAPGVLIGAGEAAAGVCSPSPVKLAIVGRPNVGKSSLINALVKSERVVVSPIPGTTRDAVDVPLEVQTEGMRESYILIDTAGLRKARRVRDAIEFFSVKRAEDSIERCDLAVLVLDAEQGIGEQDKKIADKIVAAGKACILVINKWDLVQETVRQARREGMGQRRQAAASRSGAPKRLTTLAEFGQWVQRQLFFLDYAPVVFTSATSRFHLERLLEAVRYVSGQLNQHIPTPLLNRTLQQAVEDRQPVSRLGQRLKFFYATQSRRAPPTFLLFVNRKELFSDAYKKYLTGRLRQNFGYEGCPILLVPKPRPKTIPPIRRHARSGFSK
jgi:GTP-binding protein